ncbi:hypothetical protein KY363_03705 [Candidatus Woesearchaeota archaeon]|nr:hypothetical protein [Candidatus Woesearchaeota archaeon]
MATFLELGLIEHFAVIFPVLLVFVIMFALLEKSKILGDNKGLHALIALCLAIMMLFVPGLPTVLVIIAPWFVIMIILITFFLLLLLSFGTKWDSIVKVASVWQTPHWFFLIIGLVIFIGALASVYGSSMLPYSDEGGTASVNVTDSTTGTSTDTGDFNQNVGRVIFHPKTIGLIFIFLVGSLTIKLLCGTSK